VSARVSMRVCEGVRVRMRVTKCGVCECKGEYEAECEGMRVTKCGVCEGEYEGNCEYKWRVSVMCEGVWA